MDEDRSGPAMTAATAHGWATCQHCGYKHKGYIREIEAEPELLVRCPSCGAYQWSPEPIKVKSS